MSQAFVAFGMLPSLLFLLPDVSPTSTHHRSWPSLCVAILALCLMPAGNTDMGMTFKVTKQGVELMEPHLPRLSAMRGRPFTAAVLLFELMQRGVYLLPHTRDAQSAGLAIKVCCLLLLCSWLSHVTHTDKVCCSIP